MARKSGGLNQSLEGDTPNRFQKRRQRTRDAIVRAASDVFLKKGLSDTSVTDITEAADVGYGSFYNHFHSLDDVIAAVAEETIRRIVDTTSELLPEVDNLELGPAICTRVLVRRLYEDPVIRWLLQRPYVFIDEWHKTVTPFIREYVDRTSPSAPEAFASVGGPETLIRMSPWIMMSELNHQFEQAASPDIEENLASMYTRLLGVDDARRLEILRISRDIVDAAVHPKSKTGLRRGRS